MSIAKQILQNTFHMQDHKKALQTCGLSTYLQSFLRGG